jgi:hypothetical protein
MNAAQTIDSQHAERIAAGAKCFAAALEYLNLEISALALCPPDHVSVGRNHGRECKSPGKRPMPLWKEFQKRLPTKEELRDWWRRWPLSNVGGALGPVSGIVRLDTDSEAAERQLAEFSGGDLPATWEFTSGRGRGLLFRIPPGVIFRTTPEARSARTDGELRFQAEGAQTALPPSRHSSGRRYQWRAGHSPNDIPPALAPPWMVRRYSAEAKSRKEPSPTSSSTVTSTDGDLARVLSALAGLKDARADEYDDWLHVGMALHSFDDGDEMLSHWDEWSKKSDKYQEDECQGKWESFSRDREGGLTIATLFQMAYADGWHDPTPTLRLFHEGRLVRVFGL